MDIEIPWNTNMSIVARHRLINEITILNYEPQMKKAFQMKMTY